MKKLFRILQITEELVDDILDRTYDLHFHDFEELIIVTEGSLEHSIDFTTEIVEAPMACYVPMGKLHRLVPRRDLRGWVINYKPEYIPDTRLSFYANFFSSTNVPLSPGTCLNRFDSLCGVIMAEYRQEITDHATIIHLVNGILSMVDAERKRNMPVDNTARAPQVEAFNAFLKILEENFRRSEGVSFYADRMNMSERNLNLICRNNFGKSVSEIIETRKLVEAKRLLLHSTKNVSEIGFELGYNEKSYFTRVFRSRTGLTPSAFREASHGIPS